MPAASDREQTLEEGAWLFPTRSPCALPSDPRTPSRGVCVAMGLTNRVASAGAIHWAILGWGIPLFSKNFFEPGAHSRSGVPRGCEALSVASAWIFLSYAGASWAKGDGLVFAKRSLCHFPGCWSPDLPRLGPNHEYPRESRRNGPSLRSLE